VFILKQILTISQGLDKISSFVIMEPQSNIKFAFTGGEKRALITKITVLSSLGLLSVLCPFIYLSGLFVSF
jgi:hypothetical protein